MIGGRALPANRRASFRPTRSRRRRPFHVEELPGFIRARCCRVGALFRQIVIEETTAAADSLSLSVVAVVQPFCRAVVVLLVHRVMAMVSSHSQYLCPEFNAPLSASVSTR